MLGRQPGITRSDPNVGLRGQVAALFAGVQHAARFDDHQLHFFFGVGLVLDAFRDDEHFSGAEGDAAVAEVDAELAFDDEEGFVSRRVVVPDELALELLDLELVVVHLGDDFRGPEFVELREFVLQVDGLVTHIRPQQYFIWLV